jgi:UDP-N-acetylmuramoyl-tripeptide--D-alanyl-D-alanine ligase
MVYLLSLFWFIREIKSTLFWLYLWQLKEYHIGRFIDHFRTEKGKKIFFNPYFLFKIILVFIFFQFLFKSLPTCQKNISNLFLSHLLITLYFFELAKGFFDFFKKKLKTPVFTKKIIFLIFIIFLFQIFYFFSIFQKELFSFYLLIFDILTPAIVSGIVLIFQPFTAVIRYLTIKKAKKKRGEFENLIVIGITGSYGKTSTKEFLATILEEKFPGKVLKTKEHQNSEVGISQCILNDLKTEHKIFIVEMGAYNKGGIKLLCDIAKPKIGIITGVNEQHLATFGTMENLISAEGGKELIESLPEDGLVIFNGENEVLRKIFQETKGKKRIVGISKKEFDLWAANIKVKKEVLFFQTFTKEGEIGDFNLNLIGAQNIQNLLLAICCAKELGMNFKEISEVAKKIRQEQSGIKLIKTKGLNIIDSTYSANPDGVIAHLDYLKIWEGKKVIVMPCLIELGKSSKEIHRKIGEKIAEVCGLAIIVTKDRFKEIKEKAGDKAIFLENPKEIFEKIKFFCKEGGVVLLEGRIPKEVIKLLSE